MSYHLQSIQNNMLGALENRAGANITHSIKQASDKTGVDFAYLMQQADAESSFSSGAKATTSSATGLFQFIDSTWLSMVGRYGEQYGVDTAQSESDLLDLRNDPKVSSYMAGELAKENKSTMQSLLGEDFEIGSTELYFAHFMGPSRAAGFLKANDESPNLKGADLFPKEAQANKGVFFDQNNRPRSLSEIYSKFDQKFGISTEDTSVTQVATSSSSDPAPIHIPAAQEIRDYAPRYSSSDPMAYIQKTNPYLDLLAPATPIIRKSTSAIASLSYQNDSKMGKELMEQYGLDNDLSSRLGSLLQNPAELLWLSALDDNLGDNQSS